MKALIVSGGQTPSRDLLQRQLQAMPDLIIAADAGAGVLMDAGIAFDLALGDFDSLAPPLYETLQESGRIITYPSRKDFTDTEAALREAVDRGADEVIILGATGSRLDHFMANLGLLVWAAEEHVTVRLLDDHNEIFLITGPAEIPARDGWYLSFFPIGGEVPGFSCENVAYPLQDHTLSHGSTLTVSNEFKEGPARVRFAQGKVLVMLSRD